LPLIAETLVRHAVGCEPVSTLFRPKNRVDFAELGLVGGILGGSGLIWRRIFAFRCSCGTVKTNLWISSISGAIWDR
jgi:hypothetical protein